MKVMHHCLSFKWQVGWTRMVKEIDSGITLQVCSRLYAER